MYVKIEELKYELSHGEEEYRNLQKNTEVEVSNYQKQIEELQRQLQTEKNKKWWKR